ncbi:MAG: peptidase C25 [Candidatus Dadabacteria bacterium]|nr:peptidase C25 [Candidatus Dadabacteria bacterium]
MKETNTYIRVPGKPLLPALSKTIYFPFGTKIKSVDIKTGNVNIEKISGKIEPTPKAYPLYSLKKPFNVDEDENTIEEKTIYSSSDLYPKSWYNYRFGCGLDKNERVIIFNLVCYPVRYIPNDDTIHTLEDISIKITYEESEVPIPSEKKYDLVIIAPLRFYFKLLPLKWHKEKMGISTKIKTTEAIYLTYSGRDKPEKIKKFIKRAVDNWDTKYVLLVGGRFNNRFRFHIPVRYSNLNDRDLWNDTYVTDLYYSDIYRINSTTYNREFEDWDSNGNNIFAEWSFIWDPERQWWYELDKKDILDLYPDVYIGRLACLNRREVKIVVKKIIKYEKRSIGSSWFNRMIVAGGDTTPYGDGVNEGENENDLAASFMEPIGFDIDRYWVSNGRLTANSLIPAIRKGAGFLFCAGHGSPVVWSTHPTQEPYKWIDALWLRDMFFLFNRGKLPVCVVGGCHNSQFNVGFPFMIYGILELGPDYFDWVLGENCAPKLEYVKRCWSWNLIRQIFGGTIATIGNTGLGWGSGGYSSVEDLDGWISTHFFYYYSQLYDFDNCTLGMVHTATLNGYINTFTPNDDLLDRKTVEQWALLGDPTLKIGGYPKKSIYIE